MTRSDAPLRYRQNKRAFTITTVSVLVTILKCLPAPSGRAAITFLNSLISSGRERYFLASRANSLSKLGCSSKFIVIRTDRILVVAIKHAFVAYPFAEFTRKPWNVAVGIIAQLFGVFIREPGKYFVNMFNL